MKYTIAPETKEITDTITGTFSQYPLKTAWAITIHKSQGSEYRAVVLALGEAAPRLMTRGILYTAVTRARELLIAVGDEAAAHRMIDNHVQSRRYSGLRLRLIEGAAG